MSSQVVWGSSWRCIVSVIQCGDVSTRMPGFVQQYPIVNALTVMRGAGRTPNPVDSFDNCEPIDHSHEISCDLFLFFFFVAGLEEGFFPVQPQITTAARSTNGPYFGEKKTPGTDQVPRLPFSRFDHLEVSTMPNDKKDEQDQCATAEYRFEACVWDTSVVVGAFSGPVSKQSCAILAVGTPRLKNGSSTKG